MNFNANFYSMVSCFSDMEIFSNLLSFAVSGCNTIQQIQTRDTLEKWGVCHQNHDYCYGRHLYYRLQNTMIIPFWIGLDITANNISITLTFERLTLNALSPQNSVANFNGVYSSFPNYCNPQSSFLIERQLLPNEFINLCNNHDSQILINFMNEIYNHL